MGEMSVLISRKRKFVFIHIYKNAGSSITKALIPFAANKWQYRIGRVLRKIVITQFDPQPFHPHITAPELIKLMTKSTFESFFSFAIVRNPWDWQVSLYSYMLHTPGHPQHKLIKGFGGFDEYINWRCREEVKLQRDMIYSKDGELLVNFVGRFETLDTDFKIICSRIGVSASLPRLNVSKTKPYQQYYSEETKELIRRTFDADISLFGYDF